jgi:hypothetical protein
MTSAPTPSAGRLQLQGVLLFLFVPLVLFLFVRHPEPIAASLGAGVVLMVGHRRLARPYLFRARGALCVWCHRALPADAEPVRLAETSGPLELLACPAHAIPGRRLAAHLGQKRWFFRLAIGLPLLALLAGLALAAATGAAGAPWLDDLTRAFQLAIGIVVQLIALPLLWPANPGREPQPTAFPPHNLHLLGMRALLWVLRLVGVVWIVIGARHFLAAP